MRGPAPAQLNSGWDAGPIRRVGRLGRRGTRWEERFGLVVALRLHVQPAEVHRARVAMIERRVLLDRDALSLVEDEQRRIVARLRALALPHLEVFGELALRGVDRRADPLCPEPVLER